MAVYVFCLYVSMFVNALALLIELFQISSWNLLFNSSRGAFKGPCACTVSPFQPTLIFDDGIAVLLIFSSRTSNLGIHQQNPYEGFAPWTPLWDFRPPDSLCPLSHILNTPLNSSLWRVRNGCVPTRTGGSRGQPGQFWNRHSGRLAGGNLTSL